MAIEMPDAVRTRGGRRFEQLEAGIGVRQESRFQFALRIFVRRDTVEHDARADTHRAAAPTGDCRCRIACFGIGSRHTLAVSAFAGCIERQRADRDRQAEIAATGRAIDGRVGTGALLRSVKPADRARIEPARRRLDRVDQFHRLVLWRTRDRSARKQRAQHLRECRPVAPAGLDRRRHLPHRRIRLDGKQRRHADRAGARDPRHVVAQQVDDHHVFRAVLRIVREKRSGRRIVARVGRTRRGALHRPRAQHVAVLRRTARASTTRPTCRRATRSARRSARAGAHAAAGTARAACRTRRSSAGTCS